MTTPDQGQIKEKIAQMNAAVRRSTHTRSPDEKAIAEALFHSCWHWLCQYGIAFHLDNVTDDFLLGEAPPQAGDDPYFTWQDVFVDDIHRYGGYSGDKARALVERMLRAPQPHSILRLENHQVVLTGRKPD